MTYFQQVAELADELARTGSRLAKRAAIAEAILRAHTDAPGEPDAGLFAQYLAGQPFAEADPRKLNAGGALLSRALLAVSGASDAALGAAYRRHGDMGAAAFDLLDGKAPVASTTALARLAEVFDGMAGAKTTAERAALVTGLLRAATALEAKYLLKLMLGDMRIGVKQSLVEEAIAAATQPPAMPKAAKTAAGRGRKAAAAGDPVPKEGVPVLQQGFPLPEEGVPAPQQVCAATAAEAVRPATAAEVRHAVMLEADLAGAVKRAFAGTLGEARMRLFHPLGFMLASPVETPEEAVARFASTPEAAAEAEVELLPHPGAEPSPPPTDPDAHATAGLSIESTHTAPNAPTHDSPSSMLQADAATSSPRELKEPNERPGDVSAAAVHIHALLEDKFDGMRCQVHCGDPTQPGRVALYSRNREDVTESYPEVAEAFAQLHGWTGGIADGTQPKDWAGSADDARAGRADEADGVGSKGQTERLTPAMGGSSPLILDGEILGWDFATGRALPFAVLSQRIGRKRVGNELRQRIPVVFMAFDLLYAGGELLLELPLVERRRRLEAVAARLGPRITAPLWLPEVPKDATAGRNRKGRASLDRTAGARAATGQAMLFGDATAPPTQAMLTPSGTEALTPEPPAPEPAAADLANADTVAPEFVPHIRLLLSPARTVESADDIDRAYREARARANEGVMLKAAGSAYQPGRRGLSWVKLKRELATLDVVITGAEFGNGRRAAFLSDYTFAVRGPRFAETGELLNVGKAYSGVTDAEIAELTEWLKAHTLENFGHYRTVEPLRVLEVTFNNLMRSSRHASGFAMRFPRILRVRDDKPMSEIDTLERVEDIYQSQPDKPVETSGVSSEEIGELPALDAD
jgi:DNA ligase-1